LAWTPPPLPLVVGRRDPPVLLSLLLSAAVRTGHVGKITLLIVSKWRPAGFPTRDLGRVSKVDLSREMLRAWDEAT
jgi:hypothetical protein